MARKEKAIYAPGELSRIREKLGVSDRDEANELAKKLGGEVGVERSETEDTGRLGRIRSDRVDVKIGDRPSSRPRRTVELPPDEELEEEIARTPTRRKDLDIADDPAIPISINYWERIKMDRYAGLPEYEIKSPAQVLQSVLSVFSDIPDYVSRPFIINRMAEYYKRIELLVISTRTLFPRNNAIRSEKMKKASPLTFAVLDTIRYWDIEKISGDLVRIQSRPKNVRAGDF